MMYWSNNAMNGWGFAFMSVGTVLFWALLIAGIVLLMRYLRDPGSQPPGRGRAEQILAERFARGEINDDEYRGRLETLRGQDSVRAR